MESKNKFLPLIPLTCGAAILIALLWVYMPVLTIMSSLLLNEDYSYGLLLPFVSAYIVYLKWPQIRRGSWRPSWLGLGVIALGFGLYSIGELASSFYIPCLSFIVVITGLLFLIGGWGLVRLLGFPLLLLALTIPSDTYLIKTVTLPLQLISSKLAAGLLTLMGIPVFRQGNVIDMGVRQLQVVDACSGLRYILPLLSFGIIYCYFYQRRAWKASILILSVIPLAIILNSIRVAAMGIFPSLQEGFSHSFTGWLIFIFCFGLLAFFNWVLNVIQPQVPSLPDHEAPSVDLIPYQSNTAYLPFFFAALVTVVLLGQIALRISHSPPVPLLQNFDNFPSQIGSWKGQREKIDIAIINELKTNEYVDIRFSGPDGEVSLWIAYYQSQKRGTFLHSPFTCLKGGGWKVKDSKKLELGRGLPIEYLLVEQGGTRTLVFYWYFLGGRWIINEYDYISKFYQGYDGLVRRRTDGALVRLTTVVDGDLESARERLTSFANLLVPILSQFIPD